jgi:hypothetical protein
VAFEYKEFPLTLDLVEGTSAQSSNKKISLSQRDIGVSKILFSLTFRNVSYPIPENAKIRLFIKRYNSGIVMQDQTPETGAHVIVTDAQNGKLEVLLNTDSIATPGQAEAQIEIELAAGKIMTSQKFNFFIEAALGANGEIISGNDIPMLDKALEVGEKFKDTDLNAVISVTSDVEELKKDTEENAYYISIKSFPRAAEETDDSPRWQRAINSLSDGGKVIAEVAEYKLSSTIIMKENVIIEGQGNGRWKKGTTFKYTGTGSAFTFASKTNSDSSVSPATTGAKLKNFKITTSSTDANYRNFTGIDVNCAELVMIQNLTITNAKIGIDITGSSSYIYLLDIDNIFIWNCLNEGIYVRQTGDWKNGIRIKVGDISDNGIGIRGARGIGNTIIGNASEMGRNKTGAILIEDGIWRIQGYLWIENSPYGIQSTGGHVEALEDLYCLSPINKLGGSQNIKNQTLVQPVSSTMIKKGLVFWYSFDEGSGNAIYDRTKALKGTLTSPTWNTDSSAFGTTVQVASGDISIPKDKINWLNDWTLLMLCKGPNSGYAFVAKGSDTTKNIVLRPYSNGIQLSINSTFRKNFATFPNGDPQTNMTWHIVSYNATTKIMSAYSQSGKLQDTFDLTPYPIDATLATPSLVSLGTIGTVSDEVIIFNRIISDSEIRAITSMTLPPDVKDVDFSLLKSPDGSRWKQTIDNAGVTTWVKL